MRNTLLYLFLYCLPATSAEQRIEAVRLPDMNLPRAAHCVFYANGELTVVGGHTSGFVPTPTAEYFADGQWHLIPTVYTHDDGLAVVMRDGQKTLIAGGHEKNLGIGQSFEVEMYDHATHAFDGFGCLDRKRALAQGVALDSGRVLIVGNHRGNDAMELYDGRKFFNQVKEVAVWHSSPYVLPVAHDDVIVFAAVWRDGRYQPCDTIDRLKGDPFCVPLLKRWLPMIYDQHGHAQATFMGDESKGYYAYLVTVADTLGNIALMKVEAGASRKTGEEGADIPTFTILETTHPIPTMGRWGRIKFDRTTVVDRRARRAYIVGNDSTSRAYVISVAYDQTPAPVTVYYTDPLPDFGDTTPMLTPDGDLIITGGITDDNFAPFKTVWLLRLSTTVEGLQTSDGGLQTSDKGFYWLGGLLVILAAVGLAVFLFRKHRRLSTATDTSESLENSEFPVVSEKSETPSEAAALLSSICQLLETEHLYLNADLKVTDVADALGVHRNAVSACINAQRGCTFNQFVNDYRVEHAKQLLRQTPDMKIATVGLESGFSTERSFFRAFKASTGMAPKEWVTQQSV